MSASLANEQITGGWAASLRLGFEYSGERTVLRHRNQRGPLAVQRTFHPEGDVCHLYLLHPPGGVVGGDLLEIEANTAENSCALITTPGATKFYRSAGALALQQQILNIAGGASLEWFPQENIFFPGANIRLSTEVNLDESGHYIGWEINSLGRPTIDERFEAGMIDLRLRINRNRKPLFIDRLVITDVESQQGAATLRNYPAVATLVATGADKTVLESVRDSVTCSSDEELGFTLVDDLLIARYLGNSTESARNLFIRTWQVVRPLLLEREPEKPRIWAT